jgi:TorA maturation chaperone TorD
MNQPGKQGSAPVTEEDMARAQIYHLLGALLAASPEQSLLDTVGTLTIEEGADTPFVNALRDLRATATTIKPDVLQGEYFKLFIGLGRGELLPYASWYVQGALMERILASLRQDLERMGFERQSEVHEPEDHAAALCETMGMIIAEPGLSLEQSAFFEAYIGAWMGKFFQDLEAAEGAEFYVFVGKLGRQFIDIEKQYFTLPA